MHTFLAVFAVGARVNWVAYDSGPLTVTAYNDAVIEFRTSLDRTVCEEWPTLLRALFTGELKPLP